MKANDDADVAWCLTSWPIHCLSETSWRDFHLLWMQHILLTASPTVGVWRDQRAAPRNWRDVFEALQPAKCFKLMCPMKERKEWGGVGPQPPYDHCDLRVILLFHLLQEWWLACSIYKSFSLSPLELPACFQNHFKLISFCLVAISFPCTLLLCNLIDLNYFIHP